MLYVRTKTGVLLLSLLVLGTVLQGCSSPPLALATMEETKISTTVPTTNAQLLKAYVEAVQALKSCNIDKAALQQQENIYERN